MFTPTLPQKMGIHMAAQPSAWIDMGAAKCHRGSLPDRELSCPRSPHHRDARWERVGVFRVHLRHFMKTEGAANHETSSGNTVPATKKKVLPIIACKEVTPPKPFSKCSQSSSCGSHIGPSAGGMRGTLDRPGRPGLEPSPGRVSQTQAPQTKEQELLVKMFETHWCAAKVNDLLSGGRSSSRWNVC